MPSDTIPQIVQIPPPEVYFRVDKASSISELTCKAVGEFSLKYKWVNDNKVCSLSEAGKEWCEHNSHVDMFDCGIVYNLLSLLFCTLTEGYQQSYHVRPEKIN